MTTQQPTQLDFAINSLWCSIKDAMAYKFGSDEHLIARQHVIDSCRHVLELVEREQQVSQNVKSS